LEDTSLQVRKAEAEAALSVAEASLSKLLAGASNTTINVSLRSLNQAQTAVSSAKIDLEQIKKTVAENIKQAEKTLFDLQSNLSTDITPQEQAVSLAETSYDNAKKNGLKNIANSRSSPYLFWVIR
jgi:transcriptional regulator